MLPSASVLELKKSLKIERMAIRDIRTSRVETSSRGNNNNIDWTGPNYMYHSESDCYKIRVEYMIPLQ